MAVSIRGLARDEELEPGLLLRGDVVLDAADSDFEDCTGVLEDRGEQLAGGLGGGGFLGIVKAGVDVAGDEGVVHDCVSDFGGEGGVGEDWGRCGHGFGSSEGGCETRAGLLVEEGRMAGESPENVWKALGCSIGPTTSSMVFARTMTIADATMKAIV